jgi:hypothetical protein
MSAAVGGLALHPPNGRKTETRSAANARFAASDEFMVD